MDFLEISPHALECSNAFNMIGKEWFLICAADAERECGANAMTASWGYLGNMWNKPSAVCFIRPQRYTYGLAERAERVSLCFFGEGEREMLSYFGTKSGKAIVDNFKIVVFLNGTAGNVKHIACVKSCRHKHCRNARGLLSVDYRSLRSSYHNSLREGHRMSTSYYRIPYLHFCIAR